MSIQQNVCLEIRTQFDCTQWEPAEPLQNKDWPSEEMILHSIDLVDPDSLTYEDFFQNYLVGNRPCIFSERLTAKWNSRKDWVKCETSDSSKREINFEFLSDKYGNQKVDVTNCNETIDYGSSSSCETMTLDEYIHYWKEYRAQEYPATMPCLYLKDWHIMKNWNENEPLPYTIPSYFASDWLNESCEGKEDDFKFTYMGPKGSWTPFHCDVYGSFSWSANIIGVKKWHLYPPGREKIFENRKTGRIEYDFANPGLKNSDYYEVLQESGQVIFVPSGWHHIVWNMVDTVSINHNWMNAANANFVWKNLRSALVAVQKELDDVKEGEDFDEICQGLLKANHGMNYSGFRDILASILLNRQNPNHVSNGYHYFGPCHTQFDIEAAQRLLEELA